jgi:hypothetical protein
MSNNLSVHSALASVAFGISENGLNFVVFGTVAFAVVISLLLLVSRGSDSMYDHIGRGGLTGGGDPGPAAGPPPDTAAARAEQEREIRQMLGARSERLVRRGQPPLDIDAELERLLAPAREASADAGLTEEVRQLVVARNERRARQGLEPLDVDAEVARTLRELGA